MRTLRRSKPIDERQVPEWRQAAFDRFSGASEVPMLVLTLVMVPILIIPFAVKSLPGGVESFLLSVDYFIWAIFAVEYLIRSFWRLGGVISSFTT